MNGAVTSNWTPPQRQEPRRGFSGLGVSAMIQDCLVTDGARKAIAGRDWWHVIEVAPGVVTPGWWDLRPAAERMPWPASLDGMRCLDVGTMDGFWAFELERRGAGEVVAIDLVDPRR